MRYHVYIAIAAENKIVTYTMDPGSGQLTFQKDVALPGAPGPLTVDPGRRFLYAGLRSSFQISSFLIDQGTGDLTPIGTVPLEADPCYLATDRQGRFLLSAYYFAGKVAVHRIAADGSVVTLPVEWRSTAEHAHCIR